MTVNAFGTESYTLSELIAELSVEMENHPELAERPVWVECETLHRPVTRFKMGRYGLELEVPLG